MLPHGGDRAQLIRSRSCLLYTSYEGVLVGLVDGNVVIKDEDDKELMFPLDQVAKTNLAVVF